VLRILGRANSFNVRKVLWICGELNIPFTPEDWGRGYKPASDPEFLKINPVGLIPAVIDGNVILRQRDCALSRHEVWPGAGLPTRSNQARPC
jgi:glutathione S-transferase